MKRKALLFFSLLLFISGCSIFGVHFKIHNPHRAGKFPKKTEARTLLGNQDSKFRTCYDVKWYRLIIDFSEDLLKKKSIKGLVTIKSVATTNFDTLQIDLADNMNLESIYFVGNSKTSISVDSLHFYRNEGVVFVIMNKTIKEGESFILDLSYNGVPNEAKKAPWSGGFVRKEDDLKKPWWGVACEGEGASSWWPCKDVMNDEPDSIDISLTVPKGLKAISNGKLIYSSDYISPKDGERSIFRWHVSYPINIYNITFYIGNYKLLHDTYYSEITHDTLQLNHYVLEQNYEKAKTHFQQLKKYLAFYEETFGPYPWYRDGFKLVESPYAGMEHQSAIAYGNGYINDVQNGFDYIILHETAHEWWGNSVTANDLSDMWLHEGFATYAEALYVEKTKGHNAYINYLLQDRLFIVNRRPLIGEKGIRYFNYKDTDIYMKGSWVLHSLRYAVDNDSLFMDILHSFYMENRMKEISSEKLEELVNRKTGKNFHWFFQTYLHNRFTPELEYFTQNGFIYYKWEKIGIDFSMPIEIELTGNNNQKINLQPKYGLITMDQATNSVAGINFNTNEFLYKAVENKKLVKEYGKQFHPID